MFYQKTIKRLKDSVAYEQGVKDKFVDLYYGRAKEISEVKQEIEKVRGDVADLQRTNTDQAFEIANLKQCNESLESRNDKLEYQNQLLVTVLQTLRIPIKLPAKKTRG